MPNTAAFEHVLHLLPHWNWDPAVNASVEVWAYSNANEIELFLNDTSQVSAPVSVCCNLGKPFSDTFSQGRVVNPPYAHSQWTVQFVPGNNVAAAKSCVVFHTHWIHQHNQATPALFNSNVTISR